MATSPTLSLRLWKRESFQGAFVLALLLAGALFVAVVGMALSGSRKDRDRAERLGPGVWVVLALAGGIWGLGRQRVEVRQDGERVLVTRGGQEFEIPITGAVKKVYCHQHMTRRERIPGVQQDLGLVVTYTVRVRFAQGPEWDGDLTVAWRRDGERLAAAIQQALGT